MKKIFGFLMLVAMVVGLFISCADGVSGNVCDVWFDEPLAPTSKSLTIVSENNLKTSTSDAFYWVYKATKEDDFGKVGETTSFVKFKTSGKGLGKISNLSTGKWTFEIKAYLDAGCTAQQVYDGKTKEPVDLSADKENKIEISVNRSQIAGQKGTLRINPAKISIRSDLKTMWVNNVNSGEGKSASDIGLIGTMSDYSYYVYECDKNGNETSVLTSNVNKLSATDFSILLEPGEYYVKIKISENGRNDANIYYTFLKVTIYSNCITDIKDATSGGGIEEHEIKEYNVKYYSGVCNGGETIYKSLDTFPNEFVHQYTYVKTHQYGVRDILDIPSKEGYSFGGYFMKLSSGVLNKVTQIDKYWNDDINLYAKWIDTSTSLTTFTFHDNTKAGGGDVTGVKTQVMYNGSAINSLGGWTHGAGWIFVGWNTRADGFGTWYGEGYSRDDWGTEPLELYGQWTTNTSVPTNKFIIVNYVQGGRNTYINTGVHISNVNELKHLCFTVTKQWLQKPATGSGNTHDGEGFTGDGGYWGMNPGGGNWIGVGSGMSIPGLPTIINDFLVHTYKQDGPSAKFGRDSSTWAISGTYPDRAVDMTYYMYSVYMAGDASTSFNTVPKRIYNAKFEWDGVAIRNYVPCCLTSDITAEESWDSAIHKAGEVGFWDLVNNKFYGNQSKNGLAKFTCEFSE